MSMQTAADHEHCHSEPSAVVAALLFADLRALQEVRCAEHQELDEPAMELLSAWSDGASSGLWRMSQSEADAILRPFEDADAGGYCELLQRAVSHTGRRVQEGESDWETPFIRVLDRLATRLSVDNPTALARLIADTQSVPLVTASHAHLWRFFEGLSLALQGRIDEGLGKFESLLSTSGPDEQVMMRVLSAQAHFLGEMGRYEAALTGFRRCVELWRRCGDRRGEAKALMNWGYFSYNLRSLLEARGLFQEALACFEEIGDTQQSASAQNGVGLVCRDEGRWAEAAAHFEAVADQRLRDRAMDSYARALNNLGEVQLFQGRSADAVRAFEQSLTALVSPAERMDVHINLGLALQSGGNINAALAAYTNAIGDATTAQRWTALPDAHYRRAIAYWELGETHQARSELEVAARQIEQDRGRIDDQGLKLNVAGRWQQIYEATVLLAVEEGRTEDAFLWSERARARALADAVSRNARGGERDAATDALADRVLSQVATPEEVQAALPDGTVVLSYFTTGIIEHASPFVQAMAPDNPLRRLLLTESGTLLFVVSKSSIVAFKCPLDPNTLATHAPHGVRAVRLLQPLVMRRLHEALLGPAGDCITADRWCVIPHGPLHSVPFAALMGSDGSPVVREGGPILTQAPSATILVRHCWTAYGSADADVSCTAVGYNGLPGEPFYLRHAETEAQLVATITGGTALTGPAAKKSDLRQVATRSRWLHFACHAQFIGDEPLGSFLLIGAEDQLSAREIMAEWQLRSDVVVLSACETGVAKVLAGDESLGLARAFLHAGARAALVSLWAVMDRPTCLLMHRFYKEMGRQTFVDPALALHDAQIWMRSHGPGAQIEPMGMDVDHHLPYSPYDPSLAMPVNWAGFTLLGT